MPGKNNILYPAQLRLRNFGLLQIQVINQINYQPIVNASIQIFRREDMSNPIDVLTTDISGKTTEIELTAPPIEYSMEPNQYLPYTEYAVMAEAKGYQPVLIDSAQVFPSVSSMQPVWMIPVMGGREGVRVITIEPNYLVGSYTPNVFEDEVKPMPEGEEDKPVVIPEFITVHTSVPSDITAANYTVNYVSYIKNTVSSTIFATWPQETIIANTLAILSFTLNRIYTNWYPRQGYNFDITYTVAFDHKWLYSRNIYNNISQMVDNIFNYYLSKPDILQPILTQGCKGELAICPGMISLWESKYMGDRGDNAMDMLKSFYGDSIYINSSEFITGVSMLWPGVDLAVGASGEAVIHIQYQLKTISTGFQAIPLPEEDGIYGKQTAASVREFQNIFNLPVTGNTDKATWYTITRVYNTLTRA